MKIKKSKKNLATLGLFALLATATLTLPPFQVNNSSEQSDTESVSPRTDYTEWRYKTENGKLYKRLYNISTDNWIGNWIYVCDI